MCDWQMDRMSSSEVHDQLVIPYGRVNRTRKGKRGDPVSGYTSFTMSFTEFVGGASSSGRACLCLCLLLRSDYYKVE